jgi:hypothetical protein
MVLPNIVVSENIFQYQDGKEVFLLFESDLYFQHIVARLTLDDISILGILADNKATAPFKAMRKKSFIEEMGISEANLRKTIYRLGAVDFIGTVIGNKEHKLFITDIGSLAIEKSLEGELEG